MDIFKQLHANGMTIVLVTHLMDDVAIMQYRGLCDGEREVNPFRKPRDVFKRLNFWKQFN